MRSRRLVVLVIAASLAGALAGCSNAGPGAAAATHPPTVSPSTVAPAALTSTKPVLPFSSDCGAALTQAEVSAATGTTMTLAPAKHGPIPWSIEQLGGLECDWSESASQTSVWVSIIPTASAGAQVAKQDEGKPYCYGGDVAAGQADVCSFGTVIGAWWFAGVLYTAPGSGLHATDGISALEAAIAPRLAGEHVTVPKPVPGTWSTTSDCDTISARADLASVLHDPALVGQQSDGFAEAGPGAYGALAAAGYISCGWDDGAVPATRPFTVELIPGAAWVLQSGDLTGGAPVEVAGAAMAVRVQSDGSQVDELYVSDGINLMIVEPNVDGLDVMSLEPIVAPLLAAMKAA